MELIENLLQLLVTFTGACLAGFACWKSKKQQYFLLLCFYGCFALGAGYWTLYLLLFSTTPQVFYVSEFGWVASVIFLRILQAALTGREERAFRCRSCSRGWMGLALCRWTALANASTPTITRPSSTSKIRLGGRTRSCRSSRRASQWTTKLFATQKLW